MKDMVRKEKLDQMVIDAEFLLISVVQGVALAALASFAAPIIGHLDFEHILYAISAFIFILIFWAEAISHVISFIDWPLDLTHNFLYFLASFIEVMAFYYLTDPLKWFGFITLFLIVVGLLYIQDLKLIKEREKKLIKKKGLYENILKKQIADLTVLLPAGLLFSIGSTFFIFYFPGFFIDSHIHIVLIGSQVAFGLFVLVKSIGDFKSRLLLLE